jgi:hypothetical protein
MTIKANRTLNHQPEGSPEYAECSESSPASAGFFFFLRHRDGQAIISNLRCAPAPKVHRLTSY